MHGTVDRLAGQTPVVESPFVRIKSLTKRFGAFTALNAVSLEVGKGELVCFLGPSGCWKTTLLRAIAGLDRQGLSPVEIVEGSIGGEARVIGAASLPLLAGFSRDREVLFKETA